MYANYVKQEQYNLITFPLIRPTKTVLSVRVHVYLKVSNIIQLYLTYLALLDPNLKLKLTHQNIEDQTNYPRLRQIYINLHVYIYKNISLLTIKNMNIIESFYSFRRRGPS